MITSINGRNLIKKYEGIRLSAYKCPAGVYTIGYGHTTGVKKGMIITRAQAETYLNQDIAACEKAVNIYMSRYNFNQNEYDALVSFTFNLGAGNLNKLLMKGLRKREAIADKILAYNKANGKVLKGLTNRRHDERALFVTPAKAYMFGGVDYSYVFDASYYANKYADIKKAYGYDYNGMFQHFILYGMDEHRQGIATFDVDVYAKYNSDVVAAARRDGRVNFKKLYQHYCEFGHSEGRRATE